jgi:uncharacterized 2Fe-2S/4Fe-4S cluster protein (DUF4445 family)
MGRASIEGVMLCRKLNFDKFYVYEIGLDNDNNPFVSLCKVTKYGVENVDDSTEWNNNPCLVIK